MDSDNENQGFQEQRISIVILPKKLKQIQSIPYDGRNDASLQPPISTYTDIKNYTVSPLLNSVYSLHDNNSIIANQMNEAWSAQKPTNISKQFESQAYRLIYKKFKQQKTNYRYYRQYAKDQYRTFDDDQNEQEQNQYKNLFGNWGILNNKKNTDYFENSLKFHSNFESGNLQKVYQSEQNPKQYFLILSNDTNTLGYNQWFYFKVTNKNIKNTRARIIIVNCNKKTISYMRNFGICYFSFKENYDNGSGWKKLNKNLNYNKSNNIRKDQNSWYHTLQFTYQFSSLQAVCFSLTLPYTFTKLFNQGFEIIGSTFCGNPIYVYKTGNPLSKKTILITARQHPSQTSSSFVVQGAIQRLQKINPLINLLKKHFLIVIIPMVNPDGVIHGNSRTNLMGYDINRKWQQIPNKNYSHEIYVIYHRFLKKMTNIDYLIDLHGHSKKLNCFAYFSLKKSLAVAIAFQMSQKLQYFKIQDCQIDKSMPPNTLRYFAVNQLKATKAITIQTSIHGWMDQDYQIHAFKPSQMQCIGSALIDTLSKIELRKKQNNEILKKIKFSDNHESSDSDPEGDYFNKQNIQQSKTHKKQQKKQEQLVKSPKKMRIKTVTNFYKPTASSMIRKRTKTQSITQKSFLKINLQESNLKHRYMKIDNNNNDSFSNKFQRTSKSNSLIKITNKSKMLIKSDRINIWKKKQ